MPTTTDPRLASMHHAIVLHPDDVSARMAYSDLLEECGQMERATFIKVQCELARLKLDALEKRLVCLKPFRAGVNIPTIAGVTKGTAIAPCDECEVCAMRNQEQDLFCAATDAHENVYQRLGSGGGVDRVPAWMTPSIYGTNNAHMVWHNGFPDHITTTCAAWLAHGPAVVLATPVVEVVLSDRKPDMEDLANWCAWYDGGVYPDSGSDVIPAGIYRLIEAPDGGQLGAQKLFCEPATAKDALSRAALLWARRQARLEGDNV